MSKRFGYFTIIALGLILSPGLVAQAQTPDSVVLSESASVESTVYEVPAAEKSGYLATLESRIADLEKSEQSQAKKNAEKQKKDSSKPTVKVGGRIQMDTGAFNQNDVSKNAIGNCENGSEFRRARLNVSGDFMEQFKYKFEVDFAADPVFKDTYIEVEKLPFLSGIKAGYYKEAYSLDCLTSSNYTWFIERSTPTNAITKNLGDRSMGISIGNWSEKKNYLWNLGVYDTKGIKPSDDRDGVDLIGRLAFLIYENPLEGSFLHLGGSYAYKTRNESTALQFDAKPEYGLGLTSLSTGAIKDVRSLNAFSLELIWAWRSLAIQSEFYWLKLSDQNSSTISGGYVQAGYWLTGEHYNYQKGTGTLTRNDVNCPFARRCDNSRLLVSPGAWQIAYRFSWFDLSDFNAAKSGTMYDHTFGLNWHLNTHIRLMLDYVVSNNHYNYGTYADSNGIINVVAASFQINF